jgi:predicted PurR-regulated permease PerM
MKSFATVADPNNGRLRKPATLQKPQSRSDSNQRGIAKTAQFVVIILGIVGFAYVARSVVLPFLVAWLAAMTLKPAVTWLRTWHCPAALAAAAAVLVFLSSVGAGVIWLGHPAVDWIKSMPEKIPQLKAKHEKVLQPVLRFTSTISSLGNFEVAPGSTNAPSPPPVKDNHLLGTMFTWTGSLLTGIGEAVVLTFLLLAAGDSFQQKLAEAVPNAADSWRAVEISREIQRSISRYLLTVSLINAGLGLAVGSMLWVLGMPNAAMWGGVAAILNFLPFFGPTVGMLGVGMAGLLAFDTLFAACLPVGAYLGLHLAESYLVTPFALGQRFRLNLVILFAAFMFFTWLWGVVGALLAVPLLVCLKISAGHVAALKPVEDFLSP